MQLDPPNPLSGIDDVPWRRLVHFYGRATDIPRHIRDLTTENHANARNELRGCLEHQDGVTQATPFAVWFIVKLLDAGAVRDPGSVRSLLAIIQAAARFQLRTGKKSIAVMDWDALLAESHLWPDFTNELQDEIQWETWQPTPEEWISWAALTDRFITQGLGELDC